MAIKNINTIDEPRSKIFRNRVSIAICHPTGDKWQSKTLFLAIFDLCWLIFKSIFDCRISGVCMYICIYTCMFSMYEKWFPLNIFYLASYCKNLSTLNAVAQVVEC